MTRSKKRRKRKDNNPKNRLFRILGILLITGGVALLCYHGIQKYLVHYHQEQLREEYKDFYDVIPANDATTRQLVRSITITEYLPMWLTIPAINVSLGVLYGDVTDEKLLDKAPVHFTYFSPCLYESYFIVGDLPSTNPSNVVIAAHRGSRWGFFTDLDLLEAGDEIFIDIGGYRFTYRVEYIRIVDPKDWSLVIDPVDYPALTLQTCEPKNRRATHRLFVRAALEHAILQFPYPGPEIE